MLTITYAPSDEALAQRISADLSTLPASIDTARAALVVLSPEALADRAVEQGMITALDNGQHLLPVLAKPVTLPKLINHLGALDFSERYDRDALLKAVTHLCSPEAGLPVRVRTPKVRASNRFSALILLVIILGLFVLSMLALGGGIIAFPNEEYATIDREVTQTIGAYLEANLPRTTQEALNFPSTLQAAPTRQRPLLAATATARAGDG